MLLALLFWIILILAAIGVFAPASWPHGRYLGGGATLILFVLIGLRIFKVSLQ